MCAEFIEGERTHTNIFSWPVHFLGKVRVNQGGRGHTFDAYIELDYLGDRGETWCPGLYTVTADGYMHSVELSTKIKSCGFVNAEDEATSFLIAAIRDGMWWQVFTATTFVDDGETHRVRDAFRRYVQ